MSKDCNIKGGIVSLRFWANNFNNYLLLHMPLMCKENLMASKIPRQKPKLRMKDKLQRKGK